MSTGIDFFIMLDEMHLIFTKGPYLPQEPFSFKGTVEVDEGFSNQARLNLQVADMVLLIKVEAHLPRHKHEILLCHHRIQDGNGDSFIGLVDAANDVGMEADGRVIGIMKTDLEAAVCKGVRIDGEVGHGSCGPQRRRPRGEGAWGFL